MALAAQQSTPHRISAQTSQVSLTDSALFLEDASAKLTAAEVAALADAGKMKLVANQMIPMLRIDRGEAFWFKLDVASDVSAPADWMLEVEKPVLDHILVFTRSQDGSWTAFPEVGAAHPFSARQVDHRHYVFPVSIPPGTQATFLVRVRYAGPATPKVKLWQPAALQATATGVFGFYCLYFGLCAGLLFYNFLIYVVVKDRGYLLYTCSLVFNAMALGAHSGIAAQYFWGEFTWWSSHVMYIGFAGAVFCWTQLTRHFLQLRHRLPAADKAMMVLAGALGAAAPAAALLPSNLAAMIVVSLALVAGLSVSWLSVVGAVRRWPGATYFCVAWACLYVGVVVLQLRLFGVLPDNVLTFNSLTIASAFEMVLLSLALANRINEETRQKEEAKSLALGIVQASQALGSETRLDRLHARVCQIVASVTGATSVRLVLWDADLNDWFLIGAGEGGQTIALDEAIERGLVPLDAMRQVERTLQPLSTPQGWLVLPILHHGSLSAQLMLENRAGQREFSPGTAAALEGIAGPLAVSLHSVLLYERLEEHVAARTRELRETQQELLATARRAGKAEIAINVLHNVGNSLNSVNVSAQLMRSRLDEDRIAYLGRALDLIDEHKGDLDRFLYQDVKGRLLPGYLRDVVEKIKDDQQDLKSNLENLIGSVDQIARVVATQQAHAGPSVMVEPVELAALVDDALRAASDGLRDGAVDIVKDVRQVSAVQLDKSRVLQILVSLVSNAAQAMAQAGARSHALTFRVDSDASRLRFQVEDSGCGIPKENLSRIFSHGFTARGGGSGFGLHSCALAATEMGGTLTAHSDGPDAGATFILELPYVLA